MRRWLIYVLNIGFGFLLVLGAEAQENIPVGTWRTHLSFDQLSVLAIAPDRVFAANDVGLIILDKTDGQISSVSKIDGLSGSPITAIAYDGVRDVLLVAFEDGLINTLEGNKISVFNNLAVSSAISGSRRINHININNELAFLSTDFGVVVFDLDKSEVRETYRDISDIGETLEIYESVVFQDSVFLATEKGVLAGSLNGASNLLDFRNWKRYDQGALDNPIESITIYNNELYAAINAQGIFQLQNGSWVLQTYLQSEEFTSLSSLVDNLIVTTTTQVWRIDGLAISEVAVGVLTNPNEALEDIDGTIWIAAESKGLTFVTSGVVSYAKPNGPSSNNTSRLTYTSNQIASIKGGFSGSLGPLNNKSNTDQFSNGQWSTVSSLLQIDITDQAQTSSANYFSSFGFGLERVTGQESQIFDDSNSPLTRSNSLLLIPAIESSNGGVWVANYGANLPLHFLSENLQWQSFPISQSQFPVDLLVDRLGQVWMTVDPGNGGGVVVFNPSNSESVKLTTQAGSGGLPSVAVRSMANDRDGQVWVGTDEGVVYFPNPASVFNNIDAARPIYENRFLLRDEVATAIAVDGGNRKWMGTKNGVWLFSATGEELIYNFTQDNSPLLSDVITSIAIDPKSGEVFFATDKGISSFRSTATESKFQFNEVKIFPNPVQADFNGQVAISGLYTDAIVKITDIGGRMVWQTRANGGTAIWDARQLNGSKVGTGVYLVFATAADGSDRHVGKIAIIE